MLRGEGGTLGPPPTVTLRWAHVALVSLGSPAAGYVSSHVGLSSDDAT